MKNIGIIYSSKEGPQNLYFSDNQMEAMSFVLEKAKEKKRPKAYKGDLLSVILTSEKSYIKLDTMPSGSMSTGWLITVPRD